LKSCEILQNKDKFRDFLAANGFNCPFYKGYSSKDEALSDATTFPYPVIVKPVDSAGSKGCSRVNSPLELASAIEYAHAESHSGCVIIEQFLELEGRQTGSDCFSVDNELVYCTFGSQYFDVCVGNDYAPIANVWPAIMPQAKQNELRREIQRLVKILNLGTTILNVETRVSTDGKAYIMEVSPRGGGNRIAEVLQYATNQDLIRANVCAALGMNEMVRLTEAKYNGIWAYYVLHSCKSGILLESVGIETNFRREHVIELDEWFSPGDRVCAFSGANQSLGTMILKFDSAKEALDWFKSHDWEGDYSWHDDETKKYVERAIEYLSVRGDT
jgi:biotin carboxylase